MGRKKKNKFKLISITPKPLPSIVNEGMFSGVAVDVLILKHPYSTQDDLQNLHSNVFAKTDTDDVDELMAILESMLDSMVFLHKKKDYPKMRDCALQAFELTDCEEKEDSPE